MPSASARPSTSSRPTSDADAGVAAEPERTSRPKRKLRRKGEVGWREHVGLPELGIEALRAKIDTGARTSALHAVDLEVWDQDGEPWISFHVPQRRVPRSVRCKARVVDRRWIKNTSGVPELRHVIHTTLVLGRRHWGIDVSLADRENMEFDLILGRTAIRRHRFLVDPGRSFLAGPPLGSAKPPGDKTKIVRRTRSRRQ